MLLKTGSVDNVVYEFSLAKPSWVMSNYTKLYFERYFSCQSSFLFFLGAFLNKTIILLALAGYEMFIANSALHLPTHIQRALVK